MYSNLGWILVALFACSLVLWRAASVDPGRIRIVWAAFAMGLLFWIAGAFITPLAWLIETARAFAEIVAIHLFVIFIFQVAFRRLDLPRIASDFAIGAGYLAVIFRLLSRVGVNLTGIIATSAVLTAVIGFALQDMLANLVGGLVLEVERGILAGDWIKTGEGVGRVRTVRLRYTAIETADGDTVAIPNSVLIRSPVIILGRTVETRQGILKHRKLMTFQLPYTHSPSTVMEAVDQALAASPLEGVVEDPKARCVVVDYHPQHIQYGVLAWMSRPGMENLDSSGVRTRVYFALARIGAQLESIPRVVDLHQAPRAEDSRASEVSSRFEALRRMEIFHSLSDGEAHQLASRMRDAGFAPGEVILRQGDEGDSLFVLVRGRVRILLSSESGMTEQLASLTPGDFFGEMSLLTGDRRTATAIAVDQVNCYCLAKPDLHEILASRPQLAEDIAKVLAERQQGLAAVRNLLEQSAMQQTKQESLLARIRKYFGI